MPADSWPSFCSCVATTSAASTEKNWSIFSSRAMACSVSLAAVSASPACCRLAAFINRARTCRPWSSTFSLATSLSTVLISTRVRASRPLPAFLFIRAWTSPRLLSGSL
ncbi:hypothetical protein D9M71_536920 [compost metagenome]